MPAVPSSVTVAGHKIPIIGVVAALLVVGGIVGLTVALTGQQHAPRPGTQAATAPLGPRSTSAATLPGGASSSAAKPTRSASHTPKRPRPSLARGNGSLALSANARPVHLRIPAIGVSTGVMRLGINADGTVQTPPLARHSRAGWYRFSATPGAPGSAVILGHIDSAAYGPAVFFRLGALKPGDEVDVKRSDGSTAKFRIDRVKEVAKTSFPRKLVYAPTKYPSLKLVTCGGTFDQATGNYLDNVIAFAELVGSSTA